MQRASFTVTVKNGERPPISLDADCLIIGNRQRDGGAISTLTFRCSGGIETYDVQDVLKVEFHPAGASFCPFCDGSLAHATWNHVGSGIHANPEQPKR